MDLDEYGALMTGANEGYEVVELKGGGRSIRSKAFGETMHIGSGPRSEALALHVEQQQVVRRAREWSGPGPFVVWDVGLGPAGNAVTLLEELKRDREGQSETPVEIHSFDISTAVLEFALQHVAALGYLSGWEGAIVALLEEGETEPLPGVRWVLHRGEFAERLTEAPAAAAIFHDPYSPARNPGMWSVELFAAMRRRCAGGPTLLTNYTRSTAVRVTLALAGWAVGAGAATGDKQETTVAASALGLLECPLDEEWLRRVGRSTNAAPFRAGGYQPGPITPEDEALLRALPQFAR